MTKLGLKLRLKIATWALFTDEFHSIWKLSGGKDKKFLDEYHELCRSKIVGMCGGCSELMKELLELKSMYRIRKSAGVLDAKDAKLINNCRLFEDISLKQYVDFARDVEQKQKEQQVKQKEKELKKKSLAQIKG